VRVALVVNPFASNVTPERLEAVARELGRAGQVAVERTARPRHATELARLADGDAVVVFSGDGGFNEVLNGIRDGVPIGFVPGGGRTLVPRALGIPADPVAAAGHIADALLAGRSRRISVGRVNGRRFAFAAGIGIDAEAVRRVDELGRREDGRRPGDLAFALAVVRTLAAHRLQLEPVLEVKGYGRAACAFIANGTPYTYASGVPISIAPEAEFELGLDLVAPVRVGPISLPRMAFALLTGRARRGVLYAHDQDRVEIVCDRPMPLQADGEDLGDVTEAVFEAERGAVSVLV
jgi:diacylglycerol kinase family enzyme